MTFEQWSLVISIVTAVACALCGCVLLVNRNSMVSEGISHSVLPGMAVAFFWWRDYESLWLIVSAAGCGLLLVWLSSWLSRTGRVQPDAALGIVFSTMFILGVVFVSLMLRNTHFHADCIIDGNLALASVRQLKVGGVAIGPSAFYTMLGCLVVLLLWLLVPYKELKLSLVDRHLATRFRLRPEILLFVSLTLVCLTVVVSFRIAGSVLIVAMMIAPPAAAWFLSRHFGQFLMLAVGLAIISSVMGFYASKPMSIAPTGPIAAASGFVFLLTLLFAPRTGLVTTAFKRRRQVHDLRRCLLLSRVSRGQGQFSPLDTSDVATRTAQQQALRLLSEQGLVQSTADGRFAITDRGRETMAQIDAQF